MESVEQVTQRCVELACGCRLVKHRRRAEEQRLFAVACGVAHAEAMQAAIARQWPGRVEGSRIVVRAAVAEAAEA